jgi:hypothetical protein
MVEKRIQSLPLKSVNPRHPAERYPALKHRARNVQKFLTEMLGGEWILE